MHNFHSAKIEDIFAFLKTSNQGLSTKEAAKRLAKGSLNKLPESKKWSPVLSFIRQFKSPLVYILLAAGIISWFLKEYVDTQVILAAVLINAIVGFIQENKANKTLEQLKKISVFRAIVRRDGVDQEIDGLSLVPGDILILRAGDKVPADARVFATIDLEVNEAVLTGESLPVFKNSKSVAKDLALADRKSMVYAGTYIVGGSGQAVVVSSGRQTEFGQLADLISKTESEQTPLQKKLGDLSRLIGEIVIMLALLIMVIGAWQKRDFFEIFITAVAVSVAAIPEGLTMAITVILVLGMSQILKRRALVRKLMAAETLGSITVICSDKTGTLTEGKVRLANIIIIDSQDFKLADFDFKNNKYESSSIFMALEIGLLCNNAVGENLNSDLAEEKIIGSPLETALVLAGRELGFSRQKLLQASPKLAEKPFSSQDKFMITLHQKDEHFIAYEKGAPEKLLHKSSHFWENGASHVLDSKERQKLNYEYEKLTSQGLRVLGVAFKKIDKLPWLLSSENKDWSLIDTELIFVGFLAFKDPLRSDARETIKNCLASGIRPIIITGDHPLTAYAIFKEIGLDGRAEDVLDGPALDKLSDEELKKAVRHYSLFARVTPHHKLRIIRALKSGGEVVAMTGDGLNDAPALKAADIGLSLGTATEVAKSAADIILLDDNFSVIVAAIKEGRIIFENIRKSITYLLSDSFSEIVLIIGSIWFNAPLALLPTQILWLNIVNDCLPNFSLSFERSDENVPLKRAKKTSGLIDAQMATIIFVWGLIRDLGILGLFVYLFYTMPVYGLNLAILRTLFFAILAFKSLLSVFSLRSFYQPLWRLPNNNWYLNGAVILGVILMIGAIYLPGFQRLLNTQALPWLAWLIILGIAIINIMAVEFIKYLFSFKHHAQKKLQTK